MEVCRQYFMLFLNAVLLNSVENNLDRRRRERSCPKGYSRSRAKRGVRIQTATMRAMEAAQRPREPSLRACGNREQRGGGGRRSIARYARASGGRGQGYVNTILQQNGGKTKQGLRFSRKKTCFRGHIPRSALLNTTRPKRALS